MQVIGLANGAADKPRKARKPQAFSPGVGLIRVVVRRGAPSNHADAYPPPRSAGAKRPRQRNCSPERAAFWPESGGEKVM